MVSAAIMNCFALGKELVQLLELYLAGGSPTHQRRHHHQVIGAGLVPSPPP